MHHIVSKRYESLFFLRMSFKVDLSKTQIPQNDHYNSKASKRHPIFQERNKFLVQGPEGTYLAFGFPKMSKIPKMTRFPTAVTKHQELGVFHPPFEHDG